MAKEKPAFERLPMQSVVTDLSDGLLVVDVVRNECCRISRSRIAQRLLAIHFRALNLKKLQLNALNGIFQIKMCGEILFGKENRKIEGRA